MRTVYRKIGSTNISFKLVALMVSVSVLPLIVFQTISYRTTLQSVMDTASRHTAQVLETQLDYLSLQTGQIDALADNPAWEPEFRRLLSKRTDGTGGKSNHEAIDTSARIGQLLSGHVGLSGLESIDLIAVNGQRFRVGESRHTPSDDPVDQLEQLIALTRASPGKTIWFGIDPASQRVSAHQKLIVAARSIEGFNPATGQVEPLGTLSTHFSTAYLHDHFRSPGLGDRAYLLLVDAQRQLLFHPDAQLIGQSLAQDFGALLNGGSGSVDLHLRGEEVVVTYRHVPEKDWYLVSVIPKATLTAPMRVIERATVGLLSGSLLLIAIFTVLYAKYVVHPIQVVAYGFKSFQADALAPDWRLPQLKAWLQLGELVTWFNAFLDTMQTRRQSEAELRASEAQNRALLNAIPDLIFTNDANGKYLAVHAPDVRELYIDQTQLLDRTVEEVLPKVVADLFMVAFSRAQNSEEVQDLQYALQIDNAEKFFEARVVPVSSNRIISIVRNITERKRSEEKIGTLAFFDQLTGLPNRTLLLDRLKQVTATSGRTEEFSAMLFIDLDSFKMLNDTLGHEMGDNLLKQVAQRLTRCARAADTVARIGGDEFMVLLQNVGSTELEAAAKTASIAQNILWTLSQTYKLDEMWHRSSASIGATLFGGRDTSMDELMRQADLAMYKSKEAGRNTVRFFDLSMELSVKARVVMEDDLRKALDANEFLLHYQPQVTGNDCVTGAEVLVRWMHPLRGLVPPGEFIPLAEETGLILGIGQWVLETACAQLAQWAVQPDLEHLSVAVNVSAHQFRQPDFVRKVVEALTGTGANPERLKLELTESMLVDNLQEIVQKMAELKSSGVSFSLDDFGTGYSSLSYLKRLPLNQLKIDQAFVREVLTDPSDAAIAKTIIALAQSLGLSVIAEGVETEGQRAFLAAQGCHAFQGYLFSRPTTANAFEQLVRKTGTHC